MGMMLVLHFCRISIPPFLGRCGTLSVMPTDILFVDTGLFCFSVV